MGINKFVFGDEIKFDLTADTVTPQTLAKGVTAHNAAGEQIVGVMAPEGGAGGSGIIDVTELPTSGIDENAVYRLTENIQTEKNEVYWVENSILTFEEIAQSFGIPTTKVYFVDVLPSDMQSSDLVNYSELHLYATKTDGIVYLYSSDFGVVLTLGYSIYEDTSHDKGITEDIFAETEWGIYTTFESFKEVVRYFIRENGKWKELSIKIPHSSGDLIETLIEHLPKEWFVRSDGSYIEVVKKSAFMAQLSLLTVELPDTVVKLQDGAFYGCNNLQTIELSNNLKNIGEYVFASCYGLTSITFKSTLDAIASNAFSYCDNLTTINVPWSEGEVDGAPWGATNATINYNYTEG